MPTNDLPPLSPSPLRLPSIQEMLRDVDTVAIPTPLLASQAKPTATTPLSKSATTDSPLPKSTTTNSVTHIHHSVEQHDVELDKENINPAATSSKRKQFNGEHLVQIARAVLELDPFMEPHGQKTAAWVRVCEHLVSKGNGFHAMSADAIRQKAEGLIGHQRNPTSQNPKVKSIAKILKGTTSMDTVGALADRMATRCDEAQRMSDEKKLELKKKHEEDRRGGEALRKASLTGQFRNKRKRDEVADDASLSGHAVSTSTEDPAPAPAPTPAPSVPSTSTSAPTANKTLGAESSLTSLDDDDDDDAHRTKRCRKSQRRSRANIDFEAIARHDEEAAARCEQEAAERRDFMRQTALHNAQVLGLLGNMFEFQKQQQQNN